MVACSIMWLCGSTKMLTSFTWCQHVSVSKTWSKLSVLFYNVGTLVIGYCDYHPVCFLTTSCWFFTTLRILNEMPCHPVWSLARPGQMRNIPGSAPGCRTRNRVKLSSNQAEPVQAIKSGVAYFPSISCTTSWRRSRVVPGPGSTWRTVAISRSGFTRNRRA